MVKNIRSYQISVLSSLVLAAAAMPCAMAEQVANMPLGSSLSRTATVGTTSALTQSTQPWTVSAQTGADGITVTRYINTAGTIFAVSWDGPAKPNLKALLGTYFGAMPQGIGARVATAQQGDLVIYSSGSMPHFSGYALLKSQTPAGFSIQK